MNRVTAFLVLAGVAAAPQDASCDPIYDVFHKHEKAIRQIPGVPNLSTNSCRKEAVPGVTSPE